ncbi:MAG TPA: DUF6209 family protein [Pseudonocardiaceae bacterium]|nr:DUF6209 family protein [Pseudonocardiaceae bacterium]
MDQPDHFNHAAGLLFTRDFHELRRGRLERGGDCTLLYDPARIVPDGETYLFGDPARPIVAHLRFTDDGPVLDRRLESRVGLLDYVPTTFKADGPMLTTTFPIPENAKWIMSWFTYQSATGEILYDSAYGQNHVLRFFDEVRLLNTGITVQPGAPTAIFTCRAETAAEVERMIVRYHITNQTELTEIERAMQPAGTATPVDRRDWELTAEPVPIGGVLAFDFVYYIDGERHTENNQGQYFIAAPA